MQKFELIAAGEIQAAEARAILGELPRDIDLESARKMFTAFRAWTWKALDQKRRDPELREWHDLMKRAQVRTKIYDHIAAQLQVLLDLVHESLAVAVRRPISDVLKRRNAKLILTLLRDAPGRALSKQEIMDKVGIKHANLSRLMNVLMSSGLVERISEGREAHFRLSREGQEQALGIVANVNIVLNIHDNRQEPDRQGRVRFGCQVEAHAEALHREMFDVLGSKLQTKRGKTWIASFDRVVFDYPIEIMRTVKKVGPAYYGHEQNMYGESLDTGKLIVVCRADSDRYGTDTGQKYYGPTGTVSRHMSNSNG